MKGKGFWIELGNIPNHPNPPYVKIWEAGGGDEMMNTRFFGGGWGGSCTLKHLAGEGVFFCAIQIE